MKTLRLCAPVVALSMLVAADVAAQAGETILTARSTNVAEPGDPVTIRIRSWSTPDQASLLIAALNPPTLRPGAESGQALPPGGRGGAGGRGGRAGGRGAAPEAPLSPTASLAAAIGRAATIGYLWTSDVTGYAIKYAYRLSLPSGGERIVVATDRRLGTHTAAWQPTANSLTDYEFTVIEIRFDAKGVGVGKTSLTNQVIVDSAARTVALDDYATATPILENVTRS